MGVNFEAKDFATTFGANKNKSSAAANQDRPKSEFWLNIGYVAEGAGKDGDDAFVSLPVGIPLDTQEKLKTNSGNAEFAQLQAARNDLLDQLLEFAKTLKPGQDEIFDIQVQIRRVREDTPVSVGGDNKFARKLAFAA
jgi:hypothetical protein